MSQYELGHKRTIRTMLAAPEWYSLDELNHLMAHQDKNAQALLMAWKLQRRIYSVQDGDIGLFVKFQFDAEFHPLPIVAEILELLDSDDGCATAAWFIFPNSWIAWVEGNVCIAVATMLGLRTAKRF